MQATPWVAMEPLAETPNLDRLASEGTRFASHYCNSPVCTPSRQSFFTGQMPHAAGVTTLSTSLRSGQADNRQTVEAGRLQDRRFRQDALQPARRPGLYGFDEMLTEREINQAWPQTEAQTVDARRQTKKLPWQPFRIRRGYG